MSEVVFDWGDALREDDLDVSPLMSFFGPTMYGAWAHYSHQVGEDESVSSKPWSIHAWLFEERRSYRIGSPHDLVDREDRRLIIGDVLRKGNEFLVVRRLATSHYSEFECAFYSVKPSRWSVFLGKHPKVDDFLTRFRAAKHAWANPNEGDDYDDDY